MESTLDRMARFLLANANPSIRLRLKQELRHPLALCQDIDDESLLNSIRSEPVYKLIASCQKPNGWLGNRFHGPNRDPVSMRIRRSARNSSPRSGSAGMIRCCRGQWTRS